MGVRQPVVTEVMPGPPLWVQEWYVKPPPWGTWFRVTKDEWVETSPSTWTRRIFSWATSMQVIMVGQWACTVEVVPVWG